MKNDIVDFTCCSSTIDQIESRSSPKLVKEVIRKVENGKFKEEVKKKALNRQGWIRSVCCWLGATMNS